MQIMDTNTLLTEIENFHLDTKSPSEQGTFDADGDLDIDSDEFDEIINRNTAGKEDTGDVTKAKAVSTNESSRDKLSTNMATALAARDKLSTNEDTALAARDKLSTNEDAACSGDEFDEIAQRSSAAKLEPPDRREVPGRSPRPSTVSPSRLGCGDCEEEEDQDEDDDWDTGGQPPSSMRLGPIGQDNDEMEDISFTASTPAAGDTSSKKYYLLTLQSVSTKYCLSSEGDLVDVVRRLEEDQEELSSSLMALTSHYAKVGLVISVISRHIRHITSWQVQLRLQQVVAAPTEAREELLKDLEQFAFRGIPNMRPASTGNLGLVRGACDCEAVML